MSYFEDDANDPLKQEYERVHRALTIWLSIFAFCTIGGSFGWLIPDILYGDTVDQSLYWVALPLSMYTAAAFCYWKAHYYGNRRVELIQQIIDQDIGRLRTMLEIYQQQPTDKNTVH